MHQFMSFPGGSVPAGCRWWFITLCILPHHSWHLRSHHLSLPHLFHKFFPSQSGGTAAAAPPPFRPGNPALCGSHPLVTPYYCRLGDLLCFVFMCPYCIFSVNCVFCMFLQYFDTVGWVFWPVKTVARITYTVLVETLNPAQSINPSQSSFHSGLLSRILNLYRTKWALAFFCFSFFLNIITFLFLVTCASF